MFVCKEEEKKKKKKKREKRERKYFTMQIIIPERTRCLRLPQEQMINVFLFSVIRKENT
jgi:hypothetical protein